MNSIRPRKKHTKHFIIKVIKDAFGEDWDIYEERKTQGGVVIYRGWPYGCTPSDEGISPVFSYVLTHELAEVIKTMPIKDVNKETKLTLSIIAKMRKKLGVNRIFVYRDDAFIIKNKKSLLNDSYSTLKSKFNLNRAQVNQHREWATELFSIEKGTRLRNTNHDDEYEKWFQSEKINFRDMNVEELIKKYNISKFIALKTYNRYQKLNKSLTYSENLKLEKEKEIEYLKSIKDILFEKNKNVSDIARLLGKSNSQISRMRKKLKTT